MAVKNKPVPCGFCVSAFVDSDLSPDGDLSYLSIGECLEGYQFMLASGGGKAVRIEIDVRGANGWSTVGHYFPKYCPACGRQLSEFFVSNRGDCFCKWSSLVSSAPEAARGRMKGEKENHGTEK